MATRNKSGYTSRRVDTQTDDIFSTEFIARLQREAHAQYKASNTKQMINGLFRYQGELHIQCTPSQHFMKSTFLYNLIATGGIIAVRINDNKLVGIPKGVSVEEINPMTIS